MQGYKIILKIRRVWDSDTKAERSIFANHQRHRLVRFLTKAFSISWRRANNLVGAIMSNPSRRAYVTLTPEQLGHFEALRAIEYGIRSAAPIYWEGTAEVIPEPVEEPKPEIPEIELRPGLRPRFPLD